VLHTYAEAFFLVLSTSAVGGAVGQLASPITTLVLPHEMNVLLAIMRAQVLSQRFPLYPSVGVQFSLGGRTWTMRALRNMPGDLCATTRIHAKMLPHHNVRNAKVSAAVLV